MAKIKINVWQVGYTTCKDWVIANPKNAQCREMGYVMVEDENYWEDSAWHLLNWGCWNYDDKTGRSIKPDEVHSPLDHCNSDVILQKDGTCSFSCAQCVGWSFANNLEGAIANIKNGYHNLWPFAGVKGVSGETKHDEHKAYYRKNRNEEWKEITW